MKKILLLLTFFITSVSFGQNCFEDKSDVMSYVIWNSFSSKDGNIRIEFTSDQAILRAGSSSYTYMYDSFSYLGSGYKGSVRMTELSGEGGLKLYVSCREDMMTDNNGTLLYKD